MRHLQSFRLRNRQILICRKTRYWYGKYSISNYFVCCGISMVLYLVTDSLMKKDFCLIMLIFLLQNRNVRQWIKSLIISSREFVFLLIGIMFLINTIEVIIKTGWLYYPVVIIAVVLIVYSIISLINIEKGNKNVWRELTFFWQENSNLSVPVSAWILSGW